MPSLFPGHLGFGHFGPHPPCVLDSLVLTLPVTLPPWSSPYLCEQATLVHATLVLATLLLATLVLPHPLSRVASVDLSFAVLDPGQAEILLHRVAGQGGLTRELVLQQVPSTYDCLQSPFRWTCSKSLPPQVDLSTVSPTTLAAAAACLHSFVLHRCFPSG